MSKEIYSMDFGQLSLPPLETQVLTQYQHLARQLQTLNSEIRILTDVSSDSQDSQVTAEQVLDNLRNLEKKLGLVYTFFQGAVYQLYLQNEVDQSDRENDENDENDESGESDEEEPQQ